MNDQRLWLGLLPWRRRDLPVTTQSLNTSLVVITHAPSTPKETALLQAILQSLGLDLATTPILAPDAPIASTPKAVLRLGAPLHPTEKPEFTLPTLAQLLSNPTEKRQAERILRGCRHALSIP